MHSSPAHGPFNDCGAKPLSAHTGSDLWPGNKPLPCYVAEISGWICTFPVTYSIWSMYVHSVYCVHVFICSLDVSYICDHCVLLLSLPILLLCLPFFLMIFKSLLAVICVSIYKYFLPISWFSLHIVYRAFWCMKVFSLM